MTYGMILKALLVIQTCQRLWELPIRNVQNWHIFSVELFLVREACSCAADIRICSSDLWSTTGVVIHILSVLHLWIRPVSLLTQEEKGGNEILHLDYSIKTKHWACCTYIVLSCKYFQVIRQYSFFFMNPKWIVMTENRPQRQQRAWKTIAILMNAKCAISQELRAALKHGVSLVSTSVHLGSFSFDSFVPVCRFIGRACYWWLWWRSSPPSWLTGVTVM